VGRRTLLVAAAAVVAAAGVGVVTNYATVHPPAWLAADPWRVWLLLAVAVSLAVALAMLAARGPVVTPLGASSSRLPRFAVTPASLRPPRVEPVWGRSDELIGHHPDLADSAVGDREDIDGADLHRAAGRRDLTEGTDQWTGVPGRARGTRSRCCLRRRSNAVVPGARHPAHGSMPGSGQEVGGVQRGCR